MSTGESDEALLGAFAQMESLVEPSMPALMELSAMAHVLGVGAQISTAISLKRIADALDRITTPAGVEKLVTDLRPVFEGMDK